MYGKIFRRVEEKYLINKDQYEKLLKCIDNHIEKDEYFESTICNIYFDTIKNDLLIYSIDKPVYKMKIRLRSYGIPTKNDDVFLEVKLKHKDIVGKRRVKLKLSDFYKYINKGIYDSNNQIMKELDYFFQYYKLQPSYYLAYDRKSYRGIEEEQLRITFDTNLRSRKEDLKLELGDAGKKYFKEEKYIMEIKTLDAMPLWLVRTLSELKIFPISFSKIGNIYRKDLITC